MGLPSLHSPSRGQEEPLLTCQGNAFAVQTAVINPVCPNAQNKASVGRGERWV